MARRDLEHDLRWPGQHALTWLDVRVDWRIGLTQAPGSLISFSFGFGHGLGRREEIAVYEAQVPLVASGHFLSPLASWWLSHLFYSLSWRRARFAANAKIWTAGEPSHSAAASPVHKNQCPFDWLQPCNWTAGFVKGSREFSSSNREIV